MPDFGNPFSGLKHDRLLTHEELVRAIRFMVAAEYEATQLYEQLAESTDEVLAQKVLRDIAGEEKVHVGEFLRLLKELQPDEESFYEKGAREVEDEFINKAGESVDASSTPSKPSGTSGRGLGIGKIQNRPLR